MDSDLTPAALAALRKILFAAEVESRKMAAATGLNPSQVLVLRQIGASGSITPGAVASALGFGQATITSIVERLVAAGLVTRTRGETDKRQAILRATDEGQARLQGSPTPLQQRLGEHFGELQAWEQAMIVAALERLSVMLGIAAAEPGQP